MKNTYLLKMEMRLIFDSNIFDRIIDGTLEIKNIINEGHQIYITHIQRDELEKCSKVDKRIKLLKSLHEPGINTIPTESFVYDVSRYGSAKYSNGVLFEKIKNENVNHTEDALIGETAIKNDLILVTEDKDFRNKVNKEGGTALSINELMKTLELD